MCACVPRSAVELKTRSSFTEEHYKVPHLSFTCAGCHAFGKFEAVLGVQFALHARGHSGPDVCVNSIKDRMRPDGPRRRRRGEDNRLPHEIVSTNERNAACTIGALMSHVDYGAWPDSEA